jgi:hypothetical protein
VERISLKGWLLWAAMAAMAAASAATATAGMADTSTEQSVGEGITQDSSSESESGDVGQSFEVTGSGDGSNQCAGVQGVTNTAPLQGGIDILQYDSEADDFEFEEVGGSDLNILQADAQAGDFEFDGGGDPLTVGGANETSCDQKANQGGSASG